MEPIHQIDDHYTDGVWYDAHHGDFNRIERDEENQEVVFIDPDDGTELERVDPVDFTPGDMYRVPERAVENPVSFYEDVVSGMVERHRSSVINEFPIGYDIGFQYVDERVEVVEAE